MYYGVDYYPEHWKRERWEIDADLMEQAGINVVRMAEFAWSLLEPRPEEFDFDWLDEAISILQQRGISVVLGTPTASPPPWVMQQLPDAFGVLATNRNVVYGGRRGYCPTNREYIELCRRVVSAMADHYADYTAVIGWQIDNEFGRRCFCDTCKQRFHEWLEAKYGSVEALNQAWGNVFWSHVYDDWSQIPVPVDLGLKLTYGYNPGLELDYRRFCSDAIIEFQQAQLDILREKCPENFVTHNSGFGFKDIDFHKLSAGLDFISLDFYDRLFDDLKMIVDPANAGFTYDLARGFKSRHFWMTELQGGPSGWQTVSTAPRPGEIRLWTYQAISHGADSIIYFRWRTALFGAEQYWHGVLDHDGVPRRRYREIKAIGEELKRFGQEITGLENRSEAALLISYDSLFAFQAQPNQPDFNYFRMLKRYYAALHANNVNIDVIPTGAALDSYKIVVAPALYVLKEEEAEQLKRFVAEGGVLLLTARSGVKDSFNRVVDMTLPGLLTDICGITVEEYEALPSDVSVPISLQLPQSDAPKTDVAARLWCDVIEAKGAEVLATYAGEFYAGTPAVTLNSYGKGKVCYVATFGDEKLRTAVVNWLLAGSGIQASFPVPSGVEAVKLWNGDRPVVFLYNHSDEEKVVESAEPAYDIVRGEKISGSIVLESKQVAILREP